jgi:N-acetylmuramoyl-L-alanine amidase
MNIIKKYSPNFTPGRRSYKPEAIVIHIMQGSLTGTDSWFSNCKAKVSAHYGVGKNGEVHQFVNEKDIAWHAGVITSPSWSLIKKAPNGLYINPNYYTIGIEHEGTVDADWTDAMYQSTSTLIADISKRWNIPIDRNHIIGHHEIYAVKACPGHKVDFTKLISMAIAKIGQGQQAIPKKVFPAVNAVTKVWLNVRLIPDRTLKPVKVVEPGVTLPYIGSTDQGENIQGNSTWFITKDGHWFWSGGVK